MIDFYKDNVPNMGILILNMNAYLDACAAAGGYRVRAANGPTGYARTV
jgi:hypothetical protein